MGQRSRQWTFWVCLGCLEAIWLGRGAFTGTAGPCSLLALGGVRLDSPVLYGLLLTDRLVGNPPLPPYFFFCGRQESVTRFFVGNPSHYTTQSYVRYSVLRTTHKRQ